MPRNQLITACNAPVAASLDVTSAPGAVSIDIANDAGLRPQGILKCRNRNLPAGLRI